MPDRLHLCRRSTDGWRMPPRIAGLVVLVTLCVAAPAAAADLCVSPRTGCTAPNTFGTVQGALNAAAGDGDADRVLLGGKIYTAPAAGFTYDAAGAPLELAGGRTTVLAGL